MGVPDTGGVHLWYTPLAAQQVALDRYLAMLDPEERSRADRFRFAVDRERFIIGHGLLRSLLGRYLETDPVAVAMQRGPYGKPFVEHAVLRFNLSDTKDAVLIAFAQGAEIGADIETMARVVDHTAVAEHYFTPEEVAWIGSDDAAKRRFLELWTRKEAVLKASGVGIMDDLRVLRVDAPMNEMTIVHAAFVEHAAPAYHVRTWHLGEDHIISIAGEAPMDGVRFLRA